MGENRFEKGAKVLSNILSIVVHPALLPVYGLLIILNAPTFMVHLPVGLKRIIFFLASINMTLVPLALMPLLRYRSLITSYSMEFRHERIIPMALGTTMYIVTTVIFYSYEIPMLIKSFVLAASVASTLLLVLTFKYKISVHGAGMGALLATVMILSLRMDTNLIALWLPLLIISGFLLSARLYLKSHTPIQVYSGFLLGFVTVFIVMLIF